MFFFVVNDEMRPFLVVSFKPGVEEILYRFIKVKVFTFSCSYSGGEVKTGSWFLKGT